MLLYFVIPIIICIVFYSVRNVKAKKHAIMSSDNFIVYVPDFVMWVGILGLVFNGALIVLMTIFPNNTAYWWVYVIFLFFMLLGMFFATYAAKCEIKVVNDTIYVTSYIGSKRTADFSEIKMVRKDNQSITAYTSQGKLFTIYSYYIGFAFMHDALKERDTPYYK